uniref:Helix-turn-helix domain-containing protein n=1 Tax=Escherichia coli TaxID=562 RepID=A0A3G4RXC6_ECOLX|nr:helix-turn-helix domain-containing protein [Escherichia coli]
MYIGTEEQRKKRLKELEKLNKEFGIRSEK